MKNTRTLFDLEHPFVRQESVFEWVFNEKQNKSFDKTMKETTKSVSRAENDWKALFEMILKEYDFE